MSTTSPRASGSDQARAKIGFLARRANGSEPTPPNTRRQRVSSAQGPHSINRNIFFRCHSATPSRPDTRVHHSHSELRRHSSGSSTLNLRSKLRPRLDTRQPPAELSQLGAFGQGVVLAVAWRAKASMALLPPSVIARDLLSRERGGRVHSDYSSPDKTQAHRQPVRTNKTVWRDRVT